MGTKEIRYEETVKQIMNAKGQAHKEHFQSISFMPQFASKSLEELRLEDHKQIFSGGVGGTNPATDGFGEKALLQPASTVPGSTASVVLEDGWVLLDDERLFPYTAGLFEKRESVSTPSEEHNMENGPNQSVVYDICFLVRCVSFLDGHRSKSSQNSNRAKLLLGNLLQMLVVSVLPQYKNASLEHDARKAITNAAEAFTHAYSDGVNDLEHTPFPFALFYVFHYSKDKRLNAPNPAGWQSLSRWQKHIVKIARFFIRRTRKYKDKVVAAQLSLRVWKKYKVYIDDMIGSKTMEEDDRSRLKLLIIDSTTTEGTLQANVESELHKILQNRAPQIREYAKQKLKDTQKKLAEEFSESTHTKKIVEVLNLSEADRIEIGKLFAWEKQLVGFGEVLSFTKSIIEDAMGRSRTLENHQLRHVLISGNYGSGKRTAAQLIGKWFEFTERKDSKPSPPAVGGLFGGSSGSSISFSSGTKVKLKPNPTSIQADALQGPMKPGEVHVVTGNSQGSSGTVQVGNFSYKKDVLDAVVRIKGEVTEVDSFKKCMKALELADPGTHIYWAHITKTEISRRDELSRLFDLANEQKVRIIIGDVEANVAVLNTLQCFRQFTPFCIKLPVISHSSLARMSLMYLDELGYSLSAHEHYTNRYHIMKHVVTSKYDSGHIQARNAYLAKDCVDLAITRKNGRIMEDDDVRKTPLLLTVADFDVKTVTMEEKLAKRKIVDDKIASVLGWGNEDEANTPRAWFSSQREHILRMEQEEADNATSGHHHASPYQYSGEAQDPPGHPRRVTSFEHVERDVSPSSTKPWEFNIMVEGSSGVGKTMFIKLAMEFLVAYNVIPDGPLEKKKNVTVEYLQSIKDVQGGLLLANIDTIVQNGVQAPSDAAEIIDAIASAASAPNRFVALSCVSGSLILNSSPTLRERIPHRVKVQVPSARDLVTIAKQYRNDLVFQDGLEDDLETHITETYGSEPEGGVRFIRNLVDIAVRNRSRRLTNAAKNNEKASNSLIPADFDIGKALGDPELLKEVNEEVQGLIGMEEAKRWLGDFAENVQVSNVTGDKSTLTMSYNLILTGAPGTGKTTFARMIHNFYKAHGIISGEFVEKNALEMKGEYVGHTTPLVRAAMTEAKGGTLFLDEAYALAGGENESDSFSKEAIRTLLTEVENNRTNTVVILAGYKHEMQRLVRMDDGIPRRFPHALHLSNYSADELAQIASYVARKRFKKRFEDGLEEKLSKHFSTNYRRQMGTENGGLAVNITEKAQARVGPRVFKELNLKTVKKLSPEQKRRVEEEIAIIKAVDFGISDIGTDGALGRSEAEKQAIEAEISNLIGMENVKHFFDEIKATARYIEQTGNTANLGNCLNLVLTGNPGTGKTTTSKLIQRFMHAHGLLENNNFREVNALHLKGQYTGQTAHRVSEIVKDALGGCLFIDEAYALVQDGGDTFGREVIRTLLTELSTHRSNLLVILAGYKGPMKDLIDADPGLSRRFPKQMHLRNYTGMELARIAELRATEKGYVFGDGVLPKLARWIEEERAEEMDSQNGGLSENLVEAAMRKVAYRLRNASGEEMREEMATLLYSDMCPSKEALKDRDEESSIPDKTPIPTLEEVVAATLSANGMAARTEDILSNLAKQSVAHIHIASQLSRSDWAALGVTIGERILLQSAIQKHTSADL